VKLGDCLVSMEDLSYVNSFHRTYLFKEEFEIKKFEIKIVDNVDNVSNCATYGGNRCSIKTTAAMYRRLDGV